MLTKFKRSFFILLLFFIPISAITFQSCAKDDLNDILNYLIATLDQTGWLQDKEKMNDIPEDITPLDDDDATLKTVVSLEDKFPPIGDQGQYGTCVVWSVGYNLKTSLNAIEKGWTTSQLSSKDNQTSPKDLWMSIPSGSKGTNCNGTNFEPALDALIASGAASFNAVPYTNLGSCDGKLTGDPKNKLANYRKIASDNEGLTPNNFKSYLSAGRPISIGAKLGDRFMSWNSSATISSDTYNDLGMQHAYHAMVLVGYDDNKQAFRVRNSWGPSWGDNGSIWVDYNFFCNKFCFAAFVAQNVNSISTGSDGTISSGDLSSGTDLLALYANDHESDDPDYNRAFEYQVYNSGTTTVSPSLKWTVTYMYYNAKDASKYEIIYDDYYTNEQGSEGDYGYNNNSEAISGGFWNNITVKPGEMAGDDFTISYNMPAITGQYYLVVMADSYNKIAEVNEDNNFYFITAANGKPLEFRNGVIINAMAKSSRLTTKGKRPASYSNTETQTLVKPGNLNTYTPTELKMMLLHDKKTGKLDAKRKAFRAKSGVTQAKKTRNQ